MKRPPVGVAGALVAASPLPFAVGSWAYGVQPLQQPTWTLLIAALSAMAIALSGAAIIRRPRLGFCLISLGMIGMLMLLGRILETSPALALAVTLVTLATLHVIARVVQYTRRLRLTRQSMRVARARGASLVALGFWVFVACTRLSDASWIELSSLALSCGIAGTFGAYWLLHEGARYVVRFSIFLGAALVAVLGTVLGWNWWWSCVSAAAVIPAATVMYLPVQTPPAMEQIDWWEPVLGYPERLLVATFLALCLLGSILLVLPVASATGRSLGWIDAAFTSVSAVCVTGLIVLDTPIDFNLTGQMVIVLLIQFGGLGIMTFSTAAMRLLGRRMSLRHEGVVAGLVSPQDRSQLFNVTRRLILFTFAAEALGAVCLWVAFVIQGDAVLQGLWRAVFTAVSAFCNAGFALQSDNLLPYQQNPLVLHVVAVLIIAGGLSPIVVLSIPDLLRRVGRPVAAQVKLALCTTLILLVVGFVFILAVEWHNTLGSLAFWDRFHNAWFQSVTLRTAGFNSIDIAAVRPATLSLMMVWMFIGGSPGSTAGGIKTTTIAILVLAVVAAVRGRWTVTSFGRRFSHKTVYKAAAIATVGAATVLLFLMLMQLTQAMPTGAALFETFSALGTVGLSIGGTGQLDGVGKTLIMTCMFLGRVGPITLFIFLSSRIQETVWERPEEEVEVG